MRLALVSFTLICALLLHYIGDTPQLTFVTSEESLRDSEPPWKHFLTEDQGTGDFMRS